MPIQTRLTVTRRPDSSIYVDAKIRAAKETGMKTTLVDIPIEGLSPTSLEAQVRCHHSCIRIAQFCAFGVPLTAHTTVPVGILVSVSMNAPAKILWANTIKEGFRWLSSVVSIQT